MRDLMYRAFVGALLAVPGIGCDEAEENAPMTTSAQREADRPQPPGRQAQAPQSDRVTVLFLGDSLTAGFGLDAEQAFPTLVGQMLEAEGLPVRIVNAGVSGDTTAGGVRRLDWLLGQSPDVVVVGLGANDGLRGTPLDAVEENLRQIVTRSRQAGAQVLLLGMLLPPNLGPDYTAGFRDIYPRLAGDLDVPLVPFLLEGVGGVAHFNQADGVHPTAEGQEIIAATVLPEVRAMVKEQAEDR